LLSVFLIKKLDCSSVSSYTDSIPNVAVLIACRNEAKTLPDCLEGLVKQSYPAANLRFYVGNDDSEDDTERIIKEYVSRHANIYLKNITESWGLARGKSNVLAQLARQAQPWADFYFITDADVRHNPAWIGALLGEFTEGVGLVSGNTLPRGYSWWAKLQKQDWSLALAWINGYHQLTSASQTLTALGNNMAVSAEAYWATGGYGALPFSVTEDFQLKQEVVKQGYLTKFTCAASSVADTLPITSLKELLHQRRRWMRGAVNLPLGMLAMLGLQTLWLPLLVLLFFWNWKLALALFISKIISEHLLAGSFLSKLGREKKLPFFLIYALYSGFLSLATLIFYLLPIPLEWKNRIYPKH
jgi:cellulose synthase/poly-beta-1,6-N-acetylglucosamine synthase-like glycosyltransferase